MLLLFVGANQLIDGPQFGFLTITIAHTTFSLAFVAIVVQARLADLAQRGVVATPAHPSAGHTIDVQRRLQLKREAVNAYASQLRAFGAGNYDDIFATERYWQLSVGRRSKK